jgi:hypothetical protein
MHSHVLYSGTCDDLGVQIAMLPERRSQQKVGISIFKR